MEAHPTQKNQPSRGSTWCTRIRYRVHAIRRPAAMQRARNPIKNLRAAADNSLLRHFRSCLP